MICFSIPLERFKSDKNRSDACAADAPQNPPAWPPPYIFNWDSSAPGAALLLAQATSFHNATYTAAIEAFLQMWVAGQDGVVFTPALLAFATNYKARAGVILPAPRPSPTQRLWAIPAGELWCHSLQPNDMQASHPISSWADHTVSWQ